MAKKTNNHTAAKVGAGALAAAALAVAGGYVLWEKMGKERQKKLKVWVVKARKEAVQQISRAKKMSAVEYASIIDRAVKKYGELGGADKEELLKAAKDLKKEWGQIKEHAAAMSKTVKKVAPKKRT